MSVRKTRGTASMESIYIICAYDLPWKNVRRNMSLQYYTHLVDLVTARIIVSKLAEVTMSSRVGASSRKKRRNIPPGSVWNNHMTPAGLRKKRSATISLNPPPRW